ncbi:cytochrome c peroxidase, partial [Vibrio parahaemolyticus]
MNLNMTEAELIARLSAIPGYVDAFAHAFGDGAITRPRIEQSLATFERSIVAGEAPFDRWIKGDDGAISASAKQGFELFNGKGRCS